MHEYESHVLGASIDLGKWLTGRAAAGWRLHTMAPVPANRRLDDPRGPGVELSLLVVLERPALPPAAASPWAWMNGAAENQTLTADEGPA